MSFEGALARVLDPEGLYWRYPGDEKDDPSVERLVEVRLDVPVATASMACADMSALGWALTARPDDESDLIQRLYFQRTQNLADENRRAMLESALKAADAADGCFSSWINVENENKQ